MNKDIQYNYGYDVKKEGLWIATLYKFNALPFGGDKYLKEVVEVISKESHRELMINISNWIDLINKNE